VVKANVTVLQILQLPETICQVRQHQVIGTTHIFPLMPENKYGLFRELEIILLRA
jgi:hypothetical protein